jgi:hypothetical protein
MGYLFFSTNDGRNLMRTLKRAVLTCGAYALLVMDSGQQVHAQCLACPRGGECQHYCDALKDDLKRWGGSQGTRAYGAIAYSASTTKSGSSYGYSTQGEAQRGAMRMCFLESKGAGDCVLQVWFYNTCAAIASGDDEIVSWSWQDSELLSRQYALSACVKKGGKNCEVIQSQCSR